MVTETKNKVKREILWVMFLNYVFLPFIVIVF